MSDNWKLFGLVAPAAPQAQRSAGVIAAEGVQLSITSVEQKLPANHGMTCANAGRAT
jgi:hypothetical protein